MDALEVKTRLEQAFCARFSHSVYAPGRKDYYDFEVRNLDAEQAAFDLLVMFKRGERYCCMEPGCHFGLWTLKDWQLIRAELARVGLGELPPLTIRRFRVQVEAELLVEVGVDVAPPEAQVPAPHRDRHFQAGWVVAVRRWVTVCA